MGERERSTNRFDNMKMKNLFLKSVKIFRSNQCVVKYLQELQNRKAENTNILIVILVNICWFPWMIPFDQATELLKFTYIIRESHNGTLTRLYIIYSSDPLEK